MLLPSATYQIKLQILKNGVALTTPDISFYVLMAQGTCAPYTGKWLYNNLTSSDSDYFEVRLEVIHASATVTFHDFFIKFQRVL